MTMSASITDPSEDVLQRVFGSLSLNDFFAMYWEQEALHIARNDSDHFQRMVSTAQIESLVADTALYFPDAQLSGGSENLVPEHYVDDENRIVPTRFLQGHATGSTIVMSRADRLLNSLAEVKRTMQSVLQLQCQTNVYLSPAGQQGFKPHYDSHDVVILQVSGCKTFRFYEGGPLLPFSSERFDSDRDTPGRESQVVNLQPGDTLYIPRGMMHDAIAVGSEPSLHITLGIYAITWFDLMQSLLNVQTSVQQSLRQSIPRNDWLNSTSADSIANEITSFLSAMTPAEVKGAMDLLHDKVALSGSQAVNGLLRRLIDDSDVQPDSVLRLLPNRVINTTEESETLIVRCHGQILEFNEPFADAVRQLLDNRQVHVRDLTGLDSEQQKAIVRQLVSENLAEILF